MSILKEGNGQKALLYGIDILQLWAEHETMQKNLSCSSSKYRGLFT